MLSPSPLIRPPTAVPLENGGATIPSGSAGDGLDFECGELDFIADRPAYELHHGDNLEVLANVPDAHFDSFVTDPPYGIRFMGKSWDGADIERMIESHRRKKPVEVPGFKSSRMHDGRAFSAGKYDQSASANHQFQQWTELWAREAFRTLKPGGHLVSFASTRTYHRMASGIEDAGFEIRDQLAWVFGQGFPKSKNLKGKMEGWGTALKPGWEPIVLARKPFTGTMTANVESHGTGALNIAGCRLDGSVDSNPLVRHARGFQSGGLIQGETGKGRDSIGRWPANLCHDGSDEVLEFFPQSAGQLAPASSSKETRKTQNCFGVMARGNSGAEPRNDAGSAARFFYCAKASRKDRNAGLDETFAEMPLLWSNGTKNPGSFQSEGTNRAAKNAHPTVKPVRLMRWLCRLVTPAGGLICDPFMGSGTTGRAAIEERFRFFGIEREILYMPIATARIESAKAL